MATTLSTFEMLFSFTKPDFAYSLPEVFSLVHIYLYIPFFRIVAFLIILKKQKFRSRLVVRGHSRGSTRKYTWPWTIMACRSDFFVTDDTVSDCSVAEGLISNFSAEYWRADRGYDNVAIIRCTLEEGVAPVIPPKTNRKLLRNYDKHIYKL